MLRNEKIKKHSHLPVSLVTFRAPTGSGSGSVTVITSNSNFNELANSPVCEASTICDAICSSLLNEVGPRNIFYAFLIY